MTTGTVKTILEQGEKQIEQQRLPFQTLDVELTSTASANGVSQPGRTSPTIIKIIREAQDQGNFPIYQPGDKVVLEQISGPNGPQWVVTDYLRHEPLMVLGIMFVVIVVGVGRWRGLWSLAALAISFLIITQLTLPLIMAGWSPVLVSILTAAMVLPTNFYLSHGWQAKTHLAIISTLVALFVTSILATIFIDLTHLSGLASEEAGFLLVEKSGLINLKNLIIAGVIVGAMGILDDITVSQASVVFELKQANPSFGWLELYKRGMNIGQDHISSMVNTLVLVYAGATLPLLLLFSQNTKSIGEIMNLEMIAEEVIKTLSGSIGLIVAAPLTTAITALALIQGWTKPKKQD